MKRLLDLLGSALVLVALAYGLPACGGGGSGGAGGNVPAPAPDTGALLPTVVVSSLVAGDASAAVRWDARDASGSNVAVALFRSTNPATVFQGAPFTSGTGPGSAVVTGLSNGTTYSFGIALDQGGNYTPVGGVWSVRPGAPIRVDASSNASNPDGLSPATAFRTLNAGIAAAVQAGGGNVWVAEGTYTNVASSFPSDVSIHGGFTSSFTLAARDPETHVTTLVGGATTSMLEIVQGTVAGAVDGLVLDGASAASFALDLDSADVRVSSVTVQRTTSHGVRVRSTNSVGSPNVSVVRSRVTGTGGEGMSILGTFTLRLEGSRFSSNLREGVGFDPLVAPDGVVAAVTVRDCVFANNGEDGLDVQLGAPPVAGGSSSYRVTVEGSTFEENGWLAGPLVPAGLRVDLDFELVAGWSADVLIRGCTARANKGAGIALDLDATSRTYVHRVLSTANNGDGLNVTSETATSLAMVDTSVFSGNGGAGVRASAGNVPVAAAHCVFAGNVQGGFVSSTVTSLAASSVAWKQSTPFSGARNHFGVIANDEFDPAFANAPVQYHRATAFDGTKLTLDDATTVAVGDPIELAEDGTARSVATLHAANGVGPTPAPADLDLPALVARFAVGSGVDEDYSLPVGSPAAGAGVPRIPSGTTDAGVFGAAAGGRPGDEGVVRATLFRVASTNPATTTALGANTTITVSFAGGTIDAASITNRVRVRNGAGTALTTSAVVASGILQVVPPSGGWPSGDLTLELHTGIAATDGTPLAAGLALPFRRP